MKEIRLHGRGGQGVVKASQIVVRAVVADGKNGQFIPFFGVERKGSPVFGYLRISENPIRRKMQVYQPDILVILDDSLINLPTTYSGLKPGGLVVINSKKTPDELNMPKTAKEIAIVDATGIAEEILGKNIPNTAILGAFAKASELVNKDILLDEIEKAFGTINRKVAQKAFDETKLIQC